MNERTTMTEIPDEVLDSIMQAINSGDAADYQDDLANLRAVLRQHGIGVVVQGGEAKPTEAVNAPVWFIERRDAGKTAPKWLSGFDYSTAAWTDDPNKAVRFTREQDAGSLCKKFGLFDGVGGAQWSPRPTEHLFIDAPHPTNCACPDCEPEPFVLKERTTEGKIMWAFSQIATLKGHIDSLHLSLSSQSKCLFDVQGRLDALESWQRAADGAITAMQLGATTTNPGAQTLQASIDEHGNPIPDSSKPKCERCEDTKIILLATCYSSTDQKETEVRGICSCVKVGDVVSAEVANLLPVGSQVERDGNKWERGEKNWWMVGHGLAFMDAIYDFTSTILRIGPEPTATRFDYAQAGAMPGSCVGQADSGLTATNPTDKPLPVGSDHTDKPRDICEEWAREIYSSTGPYRDMFRRLGLPEMDAVCQAVAEYCYEYRMNTLRREEAHKQVFSAMKALDAKKETNDGK